MKNGNQKTGGKRNSTETFASVSLPAFTTLTISFSVERKPKKKKKEKKTPGINKKKETIRKSKQQSPVKEMHSLVKLRLRIAVGCRLGTYLASMTTKTASKAYRD